MKNTYFTSKEFNNNWSGEVSEIMHLYERIAEDFSDFGLLSFDFTFKSDKKSNLESLAKSLVSKFSIINIEIKKKWQKFELQADTYLFPFTKDNLVYWLISFYEEGYLFDSKLIGYGALTDKNNIQFLDYFSEKEDEYYEKGLEDYERKNLWGALVNWSNCIKINPKCFQAYKNIGFLKDELHLPFDAMESYEKAIEIKPDYRTALVNLGALKDRFEEYDRAIELYNNSETYTF